MNFSQFSKFLGTTSIATILFFGMGNFNRAGSFQLFSSQTALASGDLRPQQVAGKVYQRLDFLPRENEYVDRQTGEIDENETLVNRFIRYHRYVKDRSFVSRFDWKLTLADYLGYNETVLESRYPGNYSLKENPFHQDIEIIKSLSVSQRNQLVETIFSIYNPEGAKNLETRSQFEIKNTEPEEVENNRPRLHQSQPGDADLLKF